MFTKKCPYCKEKIQSKALICKHCKSDLAPQRTPKISDVSISQPKIIEEPVPAWKGWKDMDSSEKLKKIKHVVLSSDQSWMITNEAADTVYFFYKKNEKSKVSNFMTISVKIIQDKIYVAGYFGDALKVFRVIEKDPLLKEHLVEDEAVQKMKKYEKISTIVGAVFMLFVIITILVQSRTSSTSSTYSSSPSVPEIRTASDSDASVCAKDKIRSMLKSPSSADFSFPGVTNNGGGSFLVKGTVDSQNSFGAMLRTSYTCNLELPDPDSCGGYCTFN